MSNRLLDSSLSQVFIDGPRTSLGRHICSSARFPRPQHIPVNPTGDPIIIVPHGSGFIPYHDITRPSKSRRGQAWRRKPNSKIINAHDIEIVAPFVFEDTTLRQTNVQTRWLLTPPMYQVSNQPQVVCFVQLCETCTVNGQLFGSPVHHAFTMKSTGFLSCVNQKLTGEMSRQHTHTQLNVGDVPGQQALC